MGQIFVGRAARLAGMFRIINIFRSIPIIVSNGTIGISGPAAIDCTAANCMQPKCRSWVTKKVCVLTVVRILTMARIMQFAGIITNTTVLTTGLIATIQWTHPGVDGEVELLNPC